MLTLKDYQDRALDCLSTFFRDCRTDGIVTAWVAALADQDRRGAYHAAAFGEIPCVCLRIPTGGGKTLLAAHAIAQTGKVWQDTDAPIAVWLTPSDAIRTQTLHGLKTPGHPYRLALESYFPQRVRVCDLESLITVGPHEVGKSAVIIVATIQSFRIGDTSQRNVYAFDEALEPHFQGLSPQRAAGLETVSEADLANQSYLTRADLGWVKASIANWLHLYRPIIIVDEAHNNRTHKSFETLKRLNPACIIELTATPVHGSNVLYHVGAQALKAADMIKLPIVLREHPTGWEDAVRDAILTRKRLEELSHGEAEYLRPILLFQAQAKGGAVTVDVLHQHLMEQEHIPKEQIAIATGNQKELDGVDLFNPACPVRFVITVEALKEGWDCSFAYVLCSLQESRSAKDVEQLLGCVLRMRL
jgi:type III restriction enzyme